ncbi:nucleolar protein 16-like [Ptychodera flava]|uniref:nucleolar protein 16-like n=1 Tax=Ptychodera flava TaxID=63121 RepID=UPI003969FCA5
MPSTKSSKRKKYQYNVDRRKLWKKSRRVPEIKCPQIKNAWDGRKSMKRNLAAMGLAVDPNKAIPIPKPKGPFSFEKTEVEAVPKEPPNKHVVEELEEEASLPEKKTLKLSRPEVSYCTYMMEKYGEDYKAMAMDERNYYQDTPKQIRQRINKFKSLPDQYNKYLAEKNAGKTTDTMDTA